MIDQNFLPDGVILKELIDCLRHLSWGASDILMAYARGEKPPYGFPSALEVSEGGEGPVSAADLAVNSWLLDGLNSAFPKADWDLLSEESVKEQPVNEMTGSKDWLWILDPLDGTKDFLQGTGEYAVHLALVQRNRPVLGAVLVPELEELWFGIKGHGSWCENKKGQKTPVAFSERNKLSDLILIASRNHRDKRLEDLIEKLSLGGTNSVGSVGCKVTKILKGESDVYISLSGKSAPKDWDMAAPEIVLLEAGGRFSHSDGSSLKYNKIGYEQRGCLVASHGLNHQELCIKINSEMDIIDPGFEV